MNKNTYIVVILIIVLGIVFWIFKSPREQEPSSVPASVSTESVVNANGDTASVVLSGAKIITWQTSGYPANAGVNINLLRKVSDSPRQFAVVRILATDTVNDGQETWTPQSGENTNDLYIEVTCSSTYQFAGGCSLSTEPIKVN